MDTVFDLFNTDPFKMVSLTQSINKLPFVPSFIGSSGMFEEQGIRTLTASVEERFGVLQLLPTQPRGAPSTTGTRPRRKMRALSIPHIPHDDAILADDLCGLRQFGTTNVLMAVVQAVNDKLAQMRQNHEVTHEHLRVGAVNGLLLDADGATPIYNLFNEFEVPETLVPMNFSTTMATGGNVVRGTCTGIYRAMEVALGATPFSGITAICGNNFFDALVDHDSVRTTYINWTAAEGLRQANTIRQGFYYGDILWVNYRGFVGNVNFFPTNECRFFPTGSPSLFRTYFAPADMIEAVGAPGLPIYAKQERMEFDKGVKLHTQSNPLPLCARPGCLFRGFKNGVPVAADLMNAAMENNYATRKHNVLEINPDRELAKAPVTAQLRTQQSILKDAEVLDYMQYSSKKIEELSQQIAELLHARGEDETGHAE